MLRLAIWVGVIALVFGWLLPQFIDYEQVWDAIRGLTAWQFFVLLLLGLVRVPSEALMYRALLPGLGLRHGTEAYLSSNLAGQFLPPPGSELVRFAYFRGAGFDAGAAGLGAFGSFLYPTAGRFVLPLVAFCLLLVGGDIDGDTLLVGVISLALTVAGVLVGYVALRSERSARWLGAKAERPVSWVLGKVKRDPFENGADKVAQLRLRALAVIRQGWLLGSIGVALNLALTYLILLAAVRYVGVPADELSAVDVFAAFAFAFWLGAVIPITGSGLGLVDVVLVSALAARSSASTDALVAAVVLWRVFYSFAIVPFGAITFSRFKKANPDFMRRSRELSESSPVEP